MLRTLFVLATLATVAVPAAARDQEPCDHCRPPQRCWIEPWYCNPPHEPQPYDRPMPPPRPYGGEE
jgi:hypothetical protein